MKKNFVFTFIAALALCAAQLSDAQATKDAKEANKLARDGAEASKNQEWDKAVDLLRKATALDHQISRLFINSVDTLLRRTSNFRMPSTITAKQSRSIQMTHESTNSAQRSR